MDPPLANTWIYERHLIAAEIMSFGYRHRPPPKATVVLDVRTLLYDPYIDPELREMTGRHPAVQERVLTTPGAVRLVRQTANLVDDLLADAGDPQELRVDVAVGCAGGRHRSVVLADAIAATLASRGIRVEVIHLDVDEPVMPAADGGPR